MFVNPLANKRGRAGPLNELFHKNARLNGTFFLAAVELVVVQSAIVTGFLQQLGVCSDLLDAPRIHHHNLIGG